MGGYPPHKRFSGHDVCAPNAGVSFLWLVVTEDPAFPESSEPDPLVDIGTGRAWECSTEAYFLVILFNILRGSTQQTISFL